MDHFASQSLRTIVCAIRRFDKQTFKAFKKDLNILKKHETQAESKEIYAKYEKDLDFLGIVGIEDILRPHVP